MATESYPDDPAEDFAEKLASGVQELLDAGELSKRGEIARRLTATLQRAQADAVEEAVARERRRIVLPDVDAKADDDEIAAALDRRLSGVACVAQLIAESSVNMDGDATAPREAADVVELLVAEARVLAAALREQRVESRS